MGLWNFIRFSAISSKTVSRRECNRRGTESNIFPALPIGDRTLRCRCARRPQPTIPIIVDNTTVQVALGVGRQVYKPVNKVQTSCTFSSSAPKPRRSGNVLKPGQSGVLGGYEPIGMRYSQSVISGCHYDSGSGSSAQRKSPIVHSNT